VCAREREGNTKQEVTESKSQPSRRHIKSYSPQQQQEKQ